MVKQRKVRVARFLVLALAVSSPLCLMIPGVNAANSNAATPVEARAPEVKSFMELDANRDGAIDRKESQSSPVLAKSFDAVDADKDGYLSVDEYAKGAVPM